VKIPSLRLSNFLKALRATSPLPRTTPARLMELPRFFFFKKKNAENRFFLKMGHSTQPTHQTHLCRNFLQARRYHIFAPAALHEQQTAIYGHVHVFLRNYYPHPIRDLSLRVCDIFGAVLLRWRVPSLVYFVHVFLDIFISHYPIFLVFLFFYKIGWRRTICSRTT
jgi:hypothetical protein